MIKLKSFNNPSLKQREVPFRGRTEKNKIAGTHQKIPSLLLSLYLKRRNPAR
jgi:hypothetical protein